MDNASKLDITEIYQLHSDQVFRYVFYMVHNEHTAEDLTQETFIKVHRSLETFQFQSSIQTWVYQIARNTTLDYLKRKKLVSFFDPSRLLQLIKESERSAIDIVTHTEEREQLYMYLLALKKEYREVLILRKINELSVKETALILNWSEDKVKSMTARGLKKLKEEIERKEESWNESF